MRFILWCIIGVSLVVFHHALRVVVRDANTNMTHNMARLVVDTHLRDMRGER